MFIGFIGISSEIIINRCIFQSKETISQINSLVLASCDNSYIPEFCFLTETKCNEDITVHINFFVPETGLAYNHTIEVCTLIKKICKIKKFE